ncbi:MAG: hypothetical protein IPL36_03635 [Nigerium sp.]|nr:hypothetical protein [Nigerium sp.]
MATDLYAGPVNHVAFVLPRDADIASVAQALAASVASEAVEVLDLEVVALDADGVAARVCAADDPRLGEFDTALTELLDAEDIAALGAELTAGDYGVVVVYEDRGLAPVAARVHQIGGRELWSGGVALDDLAAALADEQEEER